MGSDIASVKRELARMFLPETVEFPDGSTETWGGHTADLDTSEMTVLINEIRHWADGMSWHIPAPGEITEGLAMELDEKYNQMFWR